MAEAPWPEVGEEPFQPRDNEFPKRSYGVKVVVFRRFQPEWFDQFPWLHRHALAARNCFGTLACVQAESDLFWKMRTRHLSSALLQNDLTEINQRAMESIHLESNA
eukprot:scpid100914/ scgid35688/ 